MAVTAAIRPQGQNGGVADSLDEAKAPEEARADGVRSNGLEAPLITRSGHRVLHRSASCLTLC